MPGVLQSLNFDSPNISALTESVINELANLSSKENLDLGCKMIKKAVI